MDLRELQAQQPWVIPYSREFEESTARNTLRQVEHDIMHVLKGLGRVAAECERRDHDSRHVYDEGLIADNTADLEDVVIGNMERRNGVKLRAEP
jgi:hypothetical protein